MGWVIWRDEDNAAGESRRVFVRRITPQFVSFTTDAADARKWPTKADARAALKGTGLTTYRVSDPDAPEGRGPGRPRKTPEPAPEPDPEPAVAAETFDADADALADPE